MHKTKNALITFLNASVTFLNASITFLNDVKPTALNIDVTDDANSLKDVLFDERLSDLITTDHRAIDLQNVCIRFNLTADEDRPETCSICRVTNALRLELEHLEIFSQSNYPYFGANSYGNIYRALQRTEIVELSIASF